MPGLEGRTARVRIEYLVQLFERLSHPREFRTQAAQLLRRIRSRRRNLRHRARRCFAGKLEYVVYDHPGQAIRKSRAVKRHRNIPLLRARRTSSTKLLATADHLRTVAELIHHSFTGTSP